MTIEEIDSIKPTVPMDRQPFLVFPCSRIQSSLVVVILRLAAAISPSFDENGLNFSINDVS
jgi:hypothetical protein